MVDRQSFLVNLVGVVSGNMENILFLQDSFFERTCEVCQGLHFKLDGNHANNQANHGKILGFLWLLPPKKSPQGLQGVAKSHKNFQLGTTTGQGTWPATIDPQSLAMGSSHS